MQQIYLDNAATSPMKKEALEAMLPYFIDDYANPASIHALSKSPRAAVKAARETIAKTLNAESEEIYFTSCGSESDNWAIKGTALAKSKKEST